VQISTSERGVSLMRRLIASDCPSYMVRYRSAAN
jgi:hypothetical protein